MAELHAVNYVIAVTPLPPRKKTYLFSERLSGPKSPAGGQMLVRGMARNGK